MRSSICLSLPMWSSRPVARCSGHGIHPRSSGRRAVRVWQGMWGELHWSGDVRGSVWSNGMVARFPIIIHEELDEACSSKVGVNARQTCILICLHFALCILTPGTSTTRTPGIRTTTTRQGGGGVNGKQAGTNSCTS